MKECKDKFGVVDWEKVKDDQRCIALCIATKMGLMQEDGTVLSENFGQILKDTKADQKMKDLFEKCYKVSTEKDPCKKAVDLFECLDKN